MVPPTGRSVTSWPVQPFSLAEVVGYPSQAPPFREG